jgi:hypothetical protein
VDGRKTHRARFTGGEHQAAAQVDGSKIRTSFSDGVDLSVGSWIGLLPNGIVTSDEESVLPDDGSSKRALTPFNSSAGHFNRPSHVLLLAHGSAFASGIRKKYTSWSTRIDAV